MLVRHRIDGLETAPNYEAAENFVRHRIDGLENAPSNAIPN